MKQALQIRRKGSRLNMLRPQTDPTNNKTNDPRDLIVSQRIFESAHDSGRVGINGGINIANKPTKQQQRLPMPTLKRSNTENLTSNMKINTVRTAYALHSTEEDTNKHSTQNDRRTLSMKYRSRLKGNLHITKSETTAAAVNGRVGQDEGVLKVTSSPLKTPASVANCYPLSQRSSASLPSLQYRIAEYLKNKRNKQVCTLVLNCRQCIVTRFVHYKT